jgi:hypothetical protein
MNRNRLKAASWEEEKALHFNPRPLLEFGHPHQRVTNTTTTMPRSMPRFDADFHAALMYAVAREPLHVVRGALMDPKARACVDVPDPASSITLLEACAFR